MCYVQSLTNYRSIYCALKQLPMVYIQMTGKIRHGDKWCLVGVCLIHQIPHAECYLHTCLALSLILCSVLHVHVYGVGCNSMVPRLTVCGTI